MCLIDLLFDLLDAPEQLALALELGINSAASLAQIGQVLL
jgi:hypothetical protein